MRNLLLAAAAFALAPAIPAAAQDPDARASDTAELAEEVPPPGTGAMEERLARAEERAIAEAAMTGAPIPGINVALQLDGNLAAADTTDRDGLALFPAAEEGEYAMILQEEIPADARLLIEVDDGRAMLIDVPATTEVDSAVLRFPAGPEAMVFLRMEALDSAYSAPEPEFEPVQERPEPPVEQTHAPDDESDPALLTADEDE